MKNNKKNQYVKKIQLAEGVFDFETAVEFYIQYLETPRPDWQNEVRRPVRSNILKAMCETHAKHGQDPVHLIDKTICEGGKLYFWSDLHFFHNNIIQYASRPFKTVEHMNQEMIGNYWRSITDKDVVVFGGDVGFGEIQDVAKILQDLPGKKILVLGNHDFDKNKCTFRDYHAFDVITIAFVLQREIEETNYNILLTHYPVFHEALPKNTINIHGHIHQHSSGPKNINMSVEHTGFSPISMDEKIRELVETLK